MRKMNQKTVRGARKSSIGWFSFPKDVETYKTLTVSLTLNVLFSFFFLVSSTNLDAKTQYFDCNESSEGVAKKMILNAISSDT